MEWRLSASPICNDTPQSDYASMVKITIAPGLVWDYRTHPVINAGALLQGERIR
ncbi:hypothetical protein VCRA2110O318_150032 [Vibrio crassostreae]|nr:hypothetical protein VCRA2110O318_150032 [Vibrio crassostreae]CAK2412614.1 hypothetical protein VCRA2110O319_140070 [Vibrio crassostreae]CAK2646563.1 hypothetical protein VCRA217O317_150033 [Vibrio crassostreae]